MISIKELRKAKGETQADLAKALNVHQTAVSQWEKGRTTPDVELLPIIAEHFGVSIDFLLGREEIKKAPAVAEAEKISDPDELLGLALYNKYGTVTKEDMEDAKKVLDVFFGRRDKNENDG